MNEVVTSSPARTSWTGDPASPAWAKTQALFSTEPDVQDWLLTPAHSIGANTAMSIWMIIAGVFLAALIVTLRRHWARLKAQTNESHDGRVIDDDLLLPIEGFLLSTWAMAFGYFLLMEFEDLSNQPIFMVMLWLPIALVGLGPLGWLFWAVVFLLRRTEVRRRNRHMATRVEE